MSITSEGLQQGRGCQGRIPMDTFLDGKKYQLTNESIIEKTHPRDSHPPPNLPLEGGGN
jgi:hypothetical protein